MTAPARFTQGDLKRAAAGVLAAGLHIAKIQIDRDGNISIIPSVAKAAAENDDEWADLE